jgi:hypothetical protein
MSSGVLTTPTWKGVSRVINNVSDEATTAVWRSASLVAALGCHPSNGVLTTLLNGTDALAMARPRFIRGAFMPGMRQESDQNQAPEQPYSQKKYEHTTRVAATTGGGATGSHPAWDPV